MLVKDWMSRELLIVSPYDADRAGLPHHAREPGAPPADHQGPRCPRRPYHPDRPDAGLTFSGHLAKRLGNEFSVGQDAGP